MTNRLVPTSRPAGMTRGMTLLFAIACGAAVGNLYWAQPLLTTIADAFSISASSASLVVTATQVGYAVGAFLLLPLGDTVNRKRAVPALMLLGAVFLIVTGLAPTFTVLLVALGLLGATTVAGQFLIPLAGDLATDDQRGRVIGTVTAGLILGLLLSRAISGIVAHALGWRAIFFAAAAIMLVLTVVLARLLPTLEPRARVPYGQLIASVLGTFARSARARATMLIGASMMCVFTLFWTGLTFLLAAEPYSYSTAQIGLVSLTAIAGAISAQRVGRLFDRGLSLPAIGVGLLVTLVGVLLSGVGAGSILVVLISVAVFSSGMMGVQVLVQTRMLSIDPAARSRLNTLFVVGNFIGGGVGSTLAGVLWGFGGWPLLMLAGAIVVSIALTTWLLQRRRVLAG